MPSIDLARERESAEELFSAMARQLSRSLVVARLRRKWFLERPPRASREAARSCGDAQQRWPNVNRASPQLRAIMPSGDGARRAVPILKKRPSRTRPPDRQQQIFRARNSDSG